MIDDEDIANIRNSVSMRELAGLYGMKVTRSGFAICPFHEDKSPSMKIYDGTRGYYCFVCHAGGDIFHFVMEHDGLSFEEAVKYVAGAFNIPLSNSGAINEESRRKMEQRRQEREAQKNAEIRKKNRLRETSRQIQLFQYWQSLCEPLDALWCALQKKIDYLSVDWERCSDELFAGSEKDSGKGG